MSVYDVSGNIVDYIYSVSGNAVDVAYDVNGNEVYSSGGLISFNIFEPTNAPTNYISASSRNNRGDILDVSTSQFLSLFYDDYLTNPPDGVTVTKSSIGKDNSGTYDIYEYDFCPTNWSRLILLSSGMHSYELSASFGLANFINNLYSDDNLSNEAFRYIRENVRIKVIPVINPWGFNQNPKKYGDNIGVNPNRNFDYDDRWNDFPSYTPAQNEWNVKGAYPFAVAETINLAKWADENWTAEFWIDCHTDNDNGSYDLDVYSLSGSKLATPINNAITKIRTWFAGKYSKSAVVKHLLDSDGSIRQFWSEYVSGVPTFTLEQSPRRTTFGTTAQNSASDISNYCTNLSTFVQEFLMRKYVHHEVVPIVSVGTAENITIDASNNGARSRTVEVAVSPSDTTQNRFMWTSSDESVCAVYGGTEKTLIVALSNGTATITGTNRYNNNLSVSFTVTVTGIA